MTTSRAIPKVLVDCDGTVEGALTEVFVRRALSVPAQLELVYEIPVHAPIPELEGEIVVRVEGCSDALFDGTITATRLEVGPGGRRRFVVRGYDRLHALRRQRSLRLFTETDLFSLADGLASTVGCSLVSSGSAPIRASIVQHEVSDLDLLASEAARAGRYIRANGTEIELVDLDEYEVKGPLVLGETLLEASVETNVHEVFADHVAWGFSLDDAEGYSASANDGDLATGERHLSGQLVRAEIESHALALAARTRARLGAKILRAVVEGDPALVPGDAVDVKGVGPDATFVLTSVVHRIDHRLGFVTELDTSPPPSFEGPRAAVVAAGVVSDVGDPAARRRVRVRLFAVGDVETPWLPVCLPGAGPNKGFVTMPDQGDVVLLLAPRGDLANAVVLGGLYGRQDAPASGTAGERNHRYAWTTHAGQFVEMDADHGVVRIDDGRGTRIEMNEDRTTLHSATDVLFEAPGRRFVIKADTIDFERG